MIIVEDFCNTNKDIQNLPIDKVLEKFYAYIRVQIEKDSKTFWQETVGLKMFYPSADDIKTIKDELYDYHIILKDIPKVLSHITGETINNLAYSPDEIIELYEKRRI